MDVHATGGGFRLKEFMNSSTRNTNFFRATNNTRKGKQRYSKSNHPINQMKQYTAAGGLKSYKILTFRYQKLIWKLCKIRAQKANDVT